MLAANFLRPPAATASFAGEKGYRPRRTSHSLERSVASTYRAPYLSVSTPTAASGFGGVAEENIKVRKSILWTWGRFSILARVGSEPLPTSGAGDGERAAPSGLQEFVVRAGEILSMAFPVWVSLSCFLALWRPSSFLWFGQTWQFVGLTLTMLGMGMTLTLDNLRAAFLMPKEAITGFILQYSVMPLTGYFLSKLLKLPSYYAAGLILVSCCPGGVASNVVTYLARGNVALSVLMTAASTFSAVVMTPFLTSKLAGQFVAVDPAGLFISTVQVVLAPVLLGAVLNQYSNNLVRYVSPVMPFIAVTTVGFLCGGAIAQNASAVLASGLQVVLAVVGLHVSGFFFGYMLSRLLGIDVTSARTISIEVGMQNSVLGVVLAAKHFGNPLTAVPCAVSSICQVICGSAVAGIWRCTPSDTKEV